MSRSHHDLVKFEQDNLDVIIKRLDESIEKLNQRITSKKNDIQRIKNSCLAEAYGALVQYTTDKKRLSDERKYAEETRKRLYEIHVNVSSNYNDEEDLFFGLQTYGNPGEPIIYSWASPFGQYYILKNGTGSYCYQEGGETFELNYKNEINWQSDCIVSVNQLFTKDIGENTDITHDSFLTKLSEKRLDKESTNIIFSIQKQQAEIVCAPCDENILLQGCAGCGKSMILLHRIPVMLQNDTTLGRNSIFIISPSNAYIDFISTLMSVLGIEDIRIGTCDDYYKGKIKQYLPQYNEKYPRKNGAKLSPDEIAFFYSEYVKEHIDRYLSSIQNSLPIISETIIQFADSNKIICRDNESNTLREMIINKTLYLLQIQKLCNENRQYVFSQVKKILDELKTLSNLAQNYYRDVDSIITRNIAKVEKELEECINNKNAANTASDNYKNLCNSEAYLNEQLKKNVEIQLQLSKDILFKFFDLSGSELVRIIEEINEISSKLTFSCEVISVVLDILKTKVYNILLQMESFYNPYSEYETRYIVEIKNVKELIDNFQKSSVQYLSKFDMETISEYVSYLNELDRHMIYSTYKDTLISVLIDNSFNENAMLYPFTGYLWLLILSRYIGNTRSNQESLLAIDEAQNISKSEYQLIKYISPKAIVNLYGDINQKVPTEKGLSSWDEIYSLFDFKKYELNYNYRNAEEIALYCNNTLGTKMVPISLHGIVKEFSKFEDMFDYINIHMDTIIQTRCIVLSEDKNRTYKMFLRGISKQYKINLNSNVNKIVDDKINFLSVYDSKGLEFNTVFVIISNRMSKQEKYIAFTRTLEKLFVLYDT